MPQHFSFSSPQAFEGTRLVDLWNVPHFRFTWVFLHGVTHLVPPLHIFLVCWKFSLKVWLDSDKTFLVRLLHGQFCVLYYLHLAFIGDAEFNHLIEWVIDRSFCRKYTFSPSEISKSDTLTLCTYLHILTDLCFYLLWKLGSSFHPTSGYQWHKFHQKHSRALHNKHLLVRAQKFNF